MSDLDDLIAWNDRDGLAYEVEVEPTLTAVVGAKTTAFFDSRERFVCWTDRGFSTKTPHFHVPDGQRAYE